MEKSVDILLIHPPYHRKLGSGIVPPIGLAYLTSSLRKAGFRCELLDCAPYFNSLDKLTIENLKKWLQRKLAMTRPQLAIGIGPCTTSAIRSIVAIADTCKETYPHLPLIFGGPLSLIPHQEWLFFDWLNAFAVIKGDGEYPLSSILTQLRQGEISLDIPGVQTSENQHVEPYFVENLDILPPPSYDKFKMNYYRPSIRRDLFVYPFVPVVGSRGCPYHCNFCISGHLIKYRRHSFEYVAKVVKILRKDYRIRSVIFYDDCLFPSGSKINDEIRLFAELLNQSAPDVLWQIEIRPDVFSKISVDTFKYIFACGCRQLNIGFEKASSSQQNLLSKSFDTEEVKETCQLVAKFCPEMRITGTFILGGPQETKESILETIQFSVQLDLLFAHYYPMELYPGTPIYRFVFGENNRGWFDKIMNDKLPWGEIIYEDEDFPIAQLMDLISFAYRCFYRRQEWKEKAKRHLGRNYKKVQKYVKSWRENRFRLNQGVKM